MLPNNFISIFHFSYHVYTVTVRPSTTWFHCDGLQKGEVVKKAPSACANLCLQCLSNVPLSKSSFWLAHNNFPYNNGMRKRYIKFFYYLASMSYKRNIECKAWEFFDGVYRFIRYILIKNLSIIINLPMSSLLKQFQVTSCHLKVLQNETNPHWKTQHYLLLCLIP